MQSPLTPCFSKPKTSIAVYLTEKSIQIIQLNFKNGKFCIAKFQKFALSNSLIKNKLIYKKIKNQKLSNSKVGLVIADAYTLRKSINVSKNLSIADLDELARLEVQKISQKNLYNVCYDYLLLPSAGAITKMHIVVVEEALIIAKIKQLKAFGFLVSCIDVESSCVFRVANMLANKLDKDGREQVDLASETGRTDSANFESLPQFSPLVELGKKPSYAYLKYYAWFGLGKNKLKIFIFNQQEIFYIYEDRYINYNSENYKLSFVEIYTKIEQVLIYYYTKLSGVALSAIYLFGSYPHLDGFREFLQNNQALPVLFPDLYKIVEMNLSINIPEDSLHKLTIPLGMALAK